jgi:predicted secreted protein
MTDVYPIKSLDYKKIIYKSPIKRGNLYYSAITYDGDKPLYLETPNVYSSQKLTECENTLSVKISPEDFCVYDKLLELDEHNVTNTTENSEKWFNKSLPEDVVREMYKRITEPLTKNELPEIALRVPKLKDTVMCGVFDKDGIAIDKEDINIDTEIKCILHVKGIKFLKKYFLCDVYITQIKLTDHKMYSLHKECLFNEEDDYRLSPPEDVIDNEMIKEIEGEKIKLDALQAKRKEMNEIKNEIKSLETKLELIKEEYAKINTD